MENTFNKLACLHVKVNVYVHIYTHGKNGNTFCSDEMLQKFHFPYLRILALVLAHI